MIKLNKRPSGATLIEILIAICLASLVMLPMILIFSVTEKVTYKSINEVVACNLALQKVEELKSRPFEDLKQIIEQASDDPEEGPFKEVVLPLELNGVWNTPGVEYAREPRISFYPFVDPDPSKADFELQKILDIKRKSPDKFFINRDSDGSYFSKVNGDIKISFHIYLQS